MTAAVAEIAADHERTEGFNLRTEGAGVLIEVDAFLNIIAFHVFGGEVGVVDAHLAVVGLVEDVVVVHDLLAFHDVLFVEMLDGVGRILVGVDFSAEYEVEKADEKVFAPRAGRDRIVERSVGIAGEIDLTVDVAAPCGILGHGGGGGKLANAAQNFAGGRLSDRARRVVGGRSGDRRGGVARFAQTSGGLCRGVEGKGESEEEKQTGEGRGVLHGGEDVI